MNKIKEMGIVLLALVGVGFLGSCTPVKAKQQPQIPVKKASTAESTQPRWTEVPGLKDEYTKYFNYFGFAVPENQLTSNAIMKGVSHQANCFTCENECKPDFIFNWSRPTSTDDFVAENGYLPVILIQLDNAPPVALVGD